ncbi:hypothetical protein [Boseongicola sp. H5]|uniref:hypothetical protein n=1 Tax=Boseongicola sp. H5 TaxID=2763261 RepID=UPI001D0BCFEC|nr:hypothetical protein [Boseongicola sp. H5]
MMRAAPMLGLALAVPVVALAQSTDARMASYLNGQSNDGSILFGYENDGCTATATMTQVYSDGAERTTRTPIDYAGIRTDINEMGTVDTLEIAQINLFLRDGAEPVMVDITLTTTEPETRASWTQQGATCSDTACTITLEHPARDDAPSASLVVGGPMAGSRAEFVLDDIRALASRCAAPD